MPLTERSKGCIVNWKPGSHWQRSSIKRLCVGHSPAASVIAVWFTRTPRGVRARCHQRLGPNLLIERMLAALNRRVDRVDAQSDSGRQHHVDQELHVL